MKNELEKLKQKIKSKWTEQPLRRNMVRIGNWKYATTVPRWEKENKFIEVIRNPDYSGWAVHYGKKMKMKNKYGSHLNEKILEEYLVHDKNEGIKLIKQKIRRLTK